MAPKKAAEPKKVGRLPVVLPTAPTYVGKELTISFKLFDETSTVTIKPWSKEDIAKRISVQANIPLIVVTNKGFGPLGFAMLKTTVKPFVIREYPNDWRQYDWTNTSDHVAGMWAALTLPRHPAGRRALQQYTAYEYDGLRRALSAAVGKVIGGVEAWWEYPNMMELRVVEHVPLKPKSKARAY